ncbi:hypothetical protein D3C86_1907410 [compost metagenome]
MRVIICIAYFRTVVTIFDVVLNNRFDTQFLTQKCIQVQVSNPPVERRVGDNAFRTCIIQTETEVDMLVTARE